MTSPPLPEVFGNYALAPFIEVVVPDGVSWLPQTVGWTWLGVIAIAVGIRFFWRAVKKWHRNRYRKEALQQLQALDQLIDSAEVMAAINRILKLAAMVAFSRSRVAQLSGESWVKFLNRQCDQPPFVPEHIELLAVSSYRCEAIPSESIRQVLAASVIWVRVHRNAEDA